MDTTNKQADGERIGLVGFFDIMGYQNIIDNNQIIDVSKLISETLMKLPEKTRTAMLATAKESVPFLDEALSNIKKLIFSDTILLAFPLDPKAHLPFSRVTYRYIFLTYIAYLLRQNRGRCSKPSIYPLLLFPYRHINWERCGTG